VKLASIPRTVVAALLGSTLSLACACHGSSTMTTPGNQSSGGSAGGGSPVQQGADPLLAADGKHFAADRTYQGECMPAGSRGGCYSVTLNADGSYRNWLLDAAMMGTYEIKGDQVMLTPNAGDAPERTMTLSADRTKLDDYVYQPAAIEP
jgi:hypothetical protein